MIRSIARLMSEQSAAYTSLESLTGQLAAALTRGEPTLIEPLTRAGDAELSRMRARLLEITTKLTEFSRVRAGDASGTPIEASIREEFEKTSTELTTKARSYASVASRAASLAITGSTFAATRIQMCGVSPTTYKPPILRATTAA